MAEYFWSWMEDSQEYREIDERYGLSENPTEGELKAVAQEIIRDHGDNEDKCVYIGKGTPIKAEDIAPDDLADWLVETADDNAYSRGLYGGDDPLLEPTKEDLDDLNKQIAAVFTNWLEERNVIRHWYTICDAKAYYREGYDG